MYDLTNFLNKDVSIRFRSGEVLKGTLYAIDRLSLFIGSIDEFGELDTWTISRNDEFIIEVVK